MANSRSHSDKLRQASLFDTISEEENDLKSDFKVNVPPAREINEEKQSTPIKEIDKIDVPQSFRFISFGSGSSGNSAYIGSDKEGVIIDAGIDLKQVFDTLANNGITPEMVKGVCLSHDHGDHIRYAYTYIRKYRHLHVYCTNRVINGI